MVVEIQSKIVNPIAFGDLIIAQKNGAPIYLKQIAQVEDTQAEQTTGAFLQGKSAVSIDILRSADTNIINVVDGTYKVLDQIKSQLPDFTLKAGATLLTDENSVLFKLSMDKELRIEKDGDGFRVEAVKYPVETVTAYVSGTIESSLYNAIT